MTFGGRVPIPGVVGDRVVAEAVAGGDHAAHEGGLDPGLLADLAEGRRDVVAGEDVEDLRGVARGRAVVEGQRDGLAAGPGHGEHGGGRSRACGAGGAGAAGAIPTTAPGPIVSVGLPASRAVVTTMPTSPRTVRSPVHDRGGCGSHGATARMTRPRRCITSLPPRAPRPSQASHARAVRSVDDETRRSGRQEPDGRRRDETITDPSRTVTVPRDSGNTAVSFR
jgi:hypothetical protein